MNQISQGDPQQLPPKKGMSLAVILLLVVGGTIILLFLVFIGSGLWTWNKLDQAKIDVAVLGAQRIKQAAVLRRELDGAEGCPTVDDLVNSKKLERDKTNDPWGTPYLIECGDNDQIHVVSAGEDHRLHTDDDVRDDRPKVKN